MFHFLLAWSISIRSVCIGAPPLQCFWYRWSSPLLATTWISGNTANSLLNLSWRQTRIEKEELRIGKFLFIFGVKEKFINLPVWMDNRSVCNPKVPVELARDPPERASCSRDHAHLQSMRKLTLTLTNIWNNLVHCQKMFGKLNIRFWKFFMQIDFFTG